MEKKIKRYILYIVIIFFSIVIVGNYAIFTAPNSKPNSMYFEEIANSGVKEEISSEDLVTEIIKSNLKEMVNSEYENSYNMLTNESKAKFGNSIEKFKQEISSKYINKYSVINVIYAGYSESRDVYLYDVYLMGPPDMTKLSDEEKEFYKEKLVYVDAHIDKNNNFKIDWDV